MRKKRGAEKNVILYSLIEPFKMASKHKKLLGYLFIGQFLFLTLMILVGFKYQIQILTEGQEIILQVQEELRKQHNTEDVMEMFKENLGSITKLKEQFNRMIRLIYLLLTFSFLIWVSLNGLNWFFTALTKYDHKILNFISRFIILSVLYLVPMTLAVYWYASSSVKFMLFGDSRSMATVGTLLIILVFMYFFFISLSLIHKRTYKEIFRKTFLVGWKCKWTILTAYLIDILLFVAIGFMMKIGTTAHIIFIHLEVVAIILIMIYKRLFMYTLIHTLDKTIK